MARNVSACCRDVQQGRNTMKYGENLFGRRDSVRNARDLAHPGQNQAAGGGAAPRALTPSSAHAATPSSAHPAAAATPASVLPPSPVVAAEDSAGSKLIVGPNIKLK